MDDAFALIEVAYESSRQRGVSPLIQEPDCVCDEVCCLEQSRFLHRGEVRNVGKVVDRTPLGPAAPKPPHPELGAGIKPTLGEDQQPSLWILSLTVASRKESVEALADLLGSSLNGVLTVELGVLLDCRSVEL